jgi:hypothetical protein
MVFFLEESLSLFAAFGVMAVDRGKTAKPDQPPLNANKCR